MASEKAQLHQLRDIISNADMSNTQEAALANNARVEFDRIFSSITDSKEKAKVQSEIIGMFENGKVITDKELTADRVGMLNLRDRMGSIEIDFSTEINDIKNPADVVNFLSQYKKGSELRTKAESYVVEQLRVYIATGPLPPIDRVNVLYPQFLNGGVVRECPEVANIILGPNHQNHREIFDSAISPIIQQHAFDAAGATSWTDIWNEAKGADHNVTDQEALLFTLGESIYDTTVNSLTQVDNFTSDSANGLRTYTLATIETFINPSGAKAVEVTETQVREHLNRLVTLPDNVDRVTLNTVLDSLVRRVTSHINIEIRTQNEIKAAEDELNEAKNREKYAKWDTAVKVGSYAALGLGVGAMAFHVPGLGALIGNLAFMGEGGLTGVNKSLLASWGILGIAGIGAKWGGDVFKALTNRSEDQSKIKKDISKATQELNKVKTERDSKVDDSWSIISNVLRAGNAALIESKAGAQNVLKNINEARDRVAKAMMPQRQVRGMGGAQFGFGY